MGLGTLGFRYGQQLPVGMDLHHHIISGVIMFSCFHVTFGCDPCCVLLLRSHPALESRDADVYVVDKDDPPGVWEVQNIIEPNVYANDKGAAMESDMGYQAHTLSILVADIPGVLQQVRWLHGG